MNFDDIINTQLLKSAFARFHAALLTLFPQRKKVTITLPYNVTEYTYENSWITTDTDCYAHDMATKAEINTTVSWVFSDGYVTFTFARALTEPVVIHFGMIKGVVNS